MHSLYPPPCSFHVKSVLIWLLSLTTERVLTREIQICLHDLHGGSCLRFQPGLHSLVRHLQTMLGCPGLPFEPPTPCPSCFVRMGMAEGQVCPKWTKHWLNERKALRAKVSRSGDVAREVAGLPLGKGFPHNWGDPHQETQSWLPWDEGTRWP